MLCPGGSQCETMEMLCPRSTRGKPRVVEAITLPKESREMKVVFPATMTQLAPKSGISPKELLTSRKCVMEINGMMIQGTISSAANPVTGETLQNQRCF